MGFKYLFIIIVYIKIIKIGYFKEYNSVVIY